MTLEHPVTFLLSGPSSSSVTHPLGMCERTHFYAILTLTPSPRARKASFVTRGSSAGWGHVDIMLLPTFGRCVRTNQVLPLPLVVAKKECLLRDEFVCKRTFSGNWPVLEDGCDNQEVHSHHLHISVGPSTQGTCDDLKSGNINEGMKGQGHHRVETAHERNYPALRSKGRRN